MSSLDDGGTNGALHYQLDVNASTYNAQITIALPESVVFVFGCFIFMAIHFCHFEF